MSSVGFEWLLDWVLCYHSSVAVWCKHGNSFLFCAWFCHGDVQHGLMNLTVNLFSFVCTWSIHPYVKWGSRFVHRVRCVYVASCEARLPKEHGRTTMLYCFTYTLLSWGDNLLYKSNVLPLLYFLLPHRLPFLRALLELTGQLNRKTYFVLAIYVCLTWLFPFSFCCCTKVFKAFASQVLTASLFLEVSLVGKW